ncbi:uncharacterized protein BHQ10_006206 [Talaromyces amestolkiae]|uniref:Glutathione S-transferase n=1 Tax=Talaromyces amestolkiae TaxID=1196081 RepID=A0A364L338_TALAM|nr:uncharacterized protein BHQ10_006206 [Talaromyces amestolkiae]RAO70194.1 hypothetical protein BHQ10_006206 [Talaromyces amestolkiae]
MVQTLELWGHWGAPNPWKVALVLEELSLPYDIHYIELNETKTPSYLEITPNGRLPTLKDPNTGVTLWESGAIILFLIDQYDKEGKITYKDSPEKYLCQQWLAFQISGQGPYFGQATWFARFHPEKIQSAIDRYVNEIIRVIGVIDLGLRRNTAPGNWLVGDKCTYADLSFATWASVGYGLLKEVGKNEGLEKDYPKYFEWIAKMEEQESVKKIRDLMNQGRIAHGLKV